VVAGEMDLIFTPRTGPQGRRPVFLFHGQLRTAADWNDTIAWPGSSLLARTLCSLGLVVIAAYWSGPEWGNSAFRAEVEAARALAASMGAANDQFIVIGASMGSFESLSLAQHVPNEVACGVCTIPAVNLDYFRDNDVANARANINTAYGLAAGSTSATVPLPADANVFKDANAAQITAPFRFYGSSSDATAPWADAVTMAGKIGATAIDASPAGGHTDATIKAASLPEISQFVLAHA
jgi:alpha-beta hydrolase superfamily lysophospholipase